MENVLAYEQYYSEVERRRKAAKDKIKALRKDMSAQEKQIDVVSTAMSKLADILECPWKHISSDEALDAMLDEYTMDESLLLDMKKALSKQKETMKALLKEFYASDMMLCHLDRYENYWLNEHC